jgi:hypothetical protein
MMAGENTVEKAVFENLSEFTRMLYVKYGVDVMEEIPSDVVWLNLFESKTYSQFNEDGITEKIFDIVGTTNKFYVDFGATATENNSEIMHKNHGFTGVLWNGGDIQCEYSTVHKEYITRENVKDLFVKYEVPTEFDLLTIDIDYNDWYVWKSICEVYKPRVVIIENNPDIPPPIDKVVVYDPAGSPFHSTYSGASIQAYYNLARHLGYSLVACETKGINLFFIRDDVLEPFKNVFYKVNDVEFHYKTPKIDHPPCGEDGKHSPECNEKYKKYGIVGHRPHDPSKVWCTSEELLVVHT